MLVWLGAQPLLASAEQIGWHLLVVVSTSLSDAKFTGACDEMQVAGSKSTPSRASQSNDTMGIGSLDG